MGERDPGVKGSRVLEVRDPHTAAALGSGDVPVLGTPALLALAESACVAAIAHDLSEGGTSVGTWAEIEHDQPTPVGVSIEAEATLVSRHGRRLEFDVVVRQDDQIVARIRHRRVLVDRQRFLERVGVTASTDGTV